MSQAPRAARARGPRLGRSIAMTSREESNDSERAIVVREATQDCAAQSVTRNAPHRVENARLMSAARDELLIDP